MGPGPGGGAVPVARAGEGSQVNDAGLLRPDAGSPDAASEVVPPAASADTWDSFARGFFGTYCGSCHNDDNQGDVRRNYRVLTNVAREKNPIACGLTKSQADWAARGCSKSPRARQFPVGNGPRHTDADRDRVLRWIDGNAP